MAINKVVFGNNTIIDISDSTVTPDTLADGVVAYNKAGERIIGTMTFPATQKQGNWDFKIYDDGTFEAWFRQNEFACAITNASGNLYRSSLLSLGLPSDIYEGFDIEIRHAEVNVMHSNYPSWGMMAGIYGTGVNYYAMSGGSRNSTPNYILTAYVFGYRTSR